MRHGFTLIELLVVLVILGLIVGVSAVSIRSARVAPPTEADALVRVRDSALRMGRAIEWRQGGDSTAARQIRLLPDGRIIGAELDPIAGRTGRAQ